jgi:hypothetical protein
MTSSMPNPSGESAHPRHRHPSPDPAAYELAYDEAKRALEEQERAVSDLRSRGGQLIAAAAITTSFFGGHAISSHVHATGWLAIACFVGLSVAVLAILWPRHDWEFASAPEKLIAIYIEPEDEPPVELAMIHRDLALHMGASIRRNRGQLRWLLVAFRLGAVLLAAEVVFWVLALIQHA